MRAAEHLMVCVLAAGFARVLQDASPALIERAQGRPGAVRTHGPRATKSTRQNHRYEPEQPADSIGRRNTPGSGGCDDYSKEAINSGGPGFAGTPVCCGAC